MNVCVYTTTNDMHFRDTTDTFVCVHVHACLCARDVYVCVYEYVCVQVYESLYACDCVCVCKYSRACMFVYVRVIVCTDVSMHVRACVRSFMCM